MTDPTFPRPAVVGRLLGMAALPAAADTDPSFWRPGISDIAAIQGANVVALHDASVLNRESAPSTQSRERIATLGMTDVVFPRLAIRSGDGGFVDLMNGSLERLEPVLQSARANTVKLDPHVADSGSDI